VKIATASEIQNAIRYLRYRVSLASMAHSTWSQSEDPHGGSVLTHFGKIFSACPVRHLESDDHGLTHRIIGLADDILSEGAHGRNYPSISRRTRSR